MLEQKTHALPIVRPPARLRQRRADIHRLDAVAPPLLVLVRHRVRHHHLAQLARVQLLDRVPRQDPVRHDGDGLARAPLHHDVGGLGQRAARVCHVVDYDGDFVRDVADQDHARDFAGAGALLVDEGEVQV